MKRSFWVILTLLFFSSVLDYITGPAVSAAAFYIFPVALAGWKWGWKLGLTTAFTATLLNVITEWASPDQSLPRSTLGMSEALIFVVFLAVCALSVLLETKQKQLEEQHDEVVNLNNRFETELRSARAIQKLLLGSPPTHPAVEMEVYSEPARILGGDFVDVTLTSKDVLAIAVGDVSGKGSPAALAATMMTVLLDDAPERFHSPAQTLLYLNRRLEGYLPPDMFVTLFYGLLDLHTGELKYSSAGHERPYLFQSDLDARELSCDGLPLGMMRDADYEEKVIHLSPENLLFFYTDGLPDLKLPTGRRLGSDDMLKRLGELSHQSCPDILQGMTNEWAMEGIEATDDITMVAIRYKSTLQAKVLREVAAPGRNSNSV